MHELETNDGGVQISVAANATSRKKERTEERVSSESWYKWRIDVDMHIVLWVLRMFVLRAGDGRKHTGVNNKTPVPRMFHVLPVPGTGYSLERVELV